MRREGNYKNVQLCISLLCVFQDKTVLVVNPTAPLLQSSPEQWHVCIIEDSLLIELSFRGWRSIRDGRHRKEAALEGDGDVLSHNLLIERQTVNTETQHAFNLIASYPKKMGF